MSNSNALVYLCVIQAPAFTTAAARAVGATEDLPAPIQLHSVDALREMRACSRFPTTLLKDQVM
jgi:hypothetical protein